MAYKMVVARLGGEPIEEVEPGNLIYSFSLNRPGSISFLMPTQDPKCKKSLLDPGKRELLLYRGGSLVWGGYLWDASTENEGASVRFGGAGWFSRLRHRHVDETLDYEDIEQLDIAWDLIDFTQNKEYGDLGIQRDNPAENSNQDRDRRYKHWERKNIGEAIEELAAVINGFDFEITPDKRWKTYYPRKGGPVAHDWQIGKNIRGWANIIGAENVVTEMTGLGEGDGNSMKRSVYEDPVGLIEFGLLQGVVEFRDVKNQNTLDAHTREELRLAKIQQVQPQIQVYTNEPPFGSYAVGDMARLRIDHGYAELDQKFRLSTINVAVSNEGNEAIGLFFGEEGQDA